MVAADGGAMLIHIWIVPLDGYEEYVSDGRFVVQGAIEVEQISTSEPSAKRRGRKLLRKHPGHGLILVTSEGKQLLKEGFPC